MIDSHCHLDFKDYAVDLTPVLTRARQAGVSAALCNHSFRALGLTAYMANGGTLEEAQEAMSAFGCASQP